MSARTVCSLGLLAACLTAAATPLSAQAPVRVGTAVLWEHYGVDEGLPFGSVTEWSVPVTVSAPLGRRASFTVSGGFSRVTLSEMGDGGDDVVLSGPLDTEARLLVGIVPDRLSLLLTAVAPTGNEALDVRDAAILGPLSSQVLGFSTANLGAGGQAGAGLVGAWPVGRLALGVSASYTHALAWAPVAGQPGEWRPGGQVRLRAGLEGSVGPRTYLRLTGLVLLRGEDEMEGDPLGTAGRQFHGYVALNHGFASGNGALTLWALDSFRSSPQIEASAVGPVRFPRGNLMAAGLRLELPLGPTLRLVPRVEVRRLTEALREGPADGALQAAGATVRVGADLKVPVSPRLAFVVEGNGLFGSVGDGAGDTVGVRGARAGLHLEVRR